MSPRPIAEHEVQRILALVPWIVAHPGSTKSELAERFAITEEQVDDDLALVLMIGVPPYSPGDYLDVEEDADGGVTIRLADYFRRPLRLTPNEGLALLAAGRALLSVPGSDPIGPLATALDKLEAALDLPGLVVEVGEPPFLHEVRDAEARHERLSIDYWSAGRDEMTQREIDPLVVFFATGAWYVSAFCHRVGGERMFRVDRIRAVRPTGEHFEASEDSGEPARVFNPHPDDPKVTLRLRPSAAWVPESFPTEGVRERRDGTLDVDLVVSEDAWLERLLLRLGPEAKVVAPTDRQSTAAATAARVLARYRDTAPATT
ncbi:MAG: proteasome accessory factor [Actinomycetota bacterium]|nr:proteasome accessory factor [Actinomycetota bacterium]